MRYYAASLPRHGARIRRSPQGRSLAGGPPSPGGALRQWAVRSHQAVPELRSGFDAEPGGHQGLASFGSVPMAALVSPGDLTRDSYGGDPRQPSATVFTSPRASCAGYTHERTRSCHPVSP
jgi:hypothetical protein